MFVVVDDEVVLIHKKTGHGAGKINGPGGKIQPGETIVACAVRETQEETGITPLQPRCVIEMRFVEEDGPQWLGFGCVANSYSGELRETEEAAPFWCAIDEIPYAQMWPDDVLWLPRVLSEKPARPLVADFLFRGGTLLEHRWLDCESVYLDF